ncbi:maleylpyruvate isomerase family mycothiol-dependent enzyme [Tessaracoccus antarcticus]|uniref:Maleylpyruvate isomerase family mycothiol-dependent enzyme n=1 Tax=Tessaracoccus antarcticus TaxID=2479848 RepID=A0A3M0GE45_9ACTN|nr:maleylpyruvate isomerase family mycothiol-dependent enzyme [Tessaracoccus antarcticus]RMB59873.1 maleylpyruvate isomerase family mycothiol-dependent enzyme [Tessaracoccus antarcticus]
MTSRGHHIWSVVHDERRALVADLRRLHPEQWHTPSLCTQWDIHDVLAHLVDGAKTTRRGFIRRMLVARFDFDKETAAGVERERRADPQDTLAAFEAVLPSTNTPPAPLPTRLVEIFLHGEDIRRPLGLTSHYPVAQVIDALAYQLRTSTGMGGGKESAAGWRLITTDAEFAHGSGPEIHGTALTLLLAVSGRPVGRADLTGPGAEDFASQR